MKKREFDLLFSEYLRAQAEPEERQALAAVAESAADAEHAPSVPPELVRQMAALEDEAKRKRRKGRLTKAATGFLVALCVISITVQPVRASWISMFQSFGEIYNKYIIMQFEEVSEQASANRVSQRVLGQYHGIYVPGWVPALYQVDVIRQGDDYCKITYYNQEESTELTFIQSKVTTGIDNEVRTIPPFYANGQEYLFSEKPEENLRWLTWQTETDVFTLQADLSMDELLKIAQSVVFQK